MFRSFVKVLLSRVTVCALIAVCPYAVPCVACAGFRGSGLGLGLRAPHPQRRTTHPLRVPTFSMITIIDYYYWKKTHLRCNISYSYVTCRRGRHKTGGSAADRGASPQGVTRKRESRLYTARVLRPSSAGVRVPGRRVTHSGRRFYIIHTYI